MKNTTLKLIFAALLFIFSKSAVGYGEEDKTVLIAILAKDKAHTLPLYLDCLNKLDYDKKSIVIYINTNNNTDNTKELLEDWIEQHKHEYKYIDYESHNVENQQETKPHEWTTDRFKILGKIRNKSLKKTLEYKCDYYFVIDLDTFIIPSTLRTLISKNKPIIAPIVYAIPNPYDLSSDFFTAVDELGYYKEDPEYYKIYYMQKLGTFEVPLVHIVYLIDAKYIPKLTYVDGTWDYEFVIFSRIARRNKVGQFICNEDVFGQTIHVDPSLSLEEEIELIAPFIVVD